MPEAPRACVLCGRPYDLSRQTFRVGRRPLDLPVCATCWTRHESSRGLLRIAIALAVFAGVCGAVAGLMTGHVAPVVAGATFGLAVAVPAALLRRRNRPRRIAGEGITLDVPGVGPVRIE